MIFTFYVDLLIF